MRCIIMMAVALAGCSSNLAIRKIQPGDTATGYPYRLKFTQFEIPITWRVVGCDPSQPDGQQLKLKITAEAKDKATPDPSQYYVIDPSTLQGPFRATEFSMEWYDDRSTKTINSSVDDQTGTAIVNVLTGVAHIAKAGLFAGGGSDCNAEVVDALGKIDGKEGQEALTKQAQEDVEDQILVVTKLTAKLAAAGANADDQTKLQLANAQNLLERKAAVLAGEQSKLKRLLVVLAETRTVTWPETGSSFASDPAKPFRPSLEARQRWKMNGTSPAANVHLALLPRDGRPLPTEAELKAQGNGARAGVPYREPRPMKLYACNPDPCGTDAAALDDVNKLVKSSEVLVLQGGTMFYLPFRAQTFAHIKNSAGFAQSGVLTSAGSSQVRGAGSSIAETFKGSAEQLSAIVTNSRAAETARLTAKADEMKAKKALADAEAALAPASDADKQAMIKAYQTDATLATAERTKIEAEIALQAARAQQALAQ